MSLDIGAPASGRPAFAVTRDASGILIAKRDPALGRFAVGKAGDALEIGARPVASNWWNFCPNPRFAVNVTDGWTANGYAERVTTTPYGLPEGFDAAAMLYYESSGTFACSQNLPSGARRTDYIFADFHALALAAGSYVQFVAWNGEAVVGTEVLNLTTLGSWYWHDLFIATPGPVTEWRLGIGVPVASDTAAEASYLAGVRVGPLVDGDTDYYDGDSAGWQWTGAAHNSASRGN